MKHLFSHWGEIRRVQAHCALLLDYDGTLTPIVGRPELAILSPDMKELLKRIAQRYTLGIISGRSMDNLKKLVGIEGIYYVGNHGFEISGPEVELVKPEAKHVAPTLVKLCGELKKELNHIKGVIVEDKGPTASVHYRLVAEDESERVKKLFEKTVKSYVDSGEIKILHGKKVFEIRPNVEWDKGKAVLWIMSVVDPKGELTPIYIGDDRTDEDAFLALKNKGVTILVSEQPKKSHAKFYLKNVDGVKTFLDKLVKEKS